MNAFSVLAHETLEMRYVHVPPVLSIKSARYSTPSAESGRTISSLMRVTICRSAGCSPWTESVESGNDLRGHVQHCVTKGKHCPESFSTLMRQTKPADGRLWTSDSDTWVTDVPEADFL